MKQTMIDQRNWDRLDGWAEAQPEFDGTLNVHVWNYGRRKLTGVLGPAPHRIGQGDGNTPITLEQYRTALEPWGRHKRNAA